MQPRRLLLPRPPRHRHPQAAMPCSRVAPQRRPACQPFTARTPRPRPTRCGNACIQTRFLPSSSRWARWLERGAAGISHAAVQAKGRGVWVMLGSQTGQHLDSPHVTFVEEQPSQSCTCASCQRSLCISCQLTACAPCSACWVPPLAPPLAYRPSFPQTFLACPSWAQELAARRNIVANPVRMQEIKQQVRSQPASPAMAGTPVSWRGPHASRCSVQIHTNTL